jgi:predicted site-specific integrase-resolvase
LKVEKAVNARARAAQYVRMSTGHQKYSTENQSEAIAAYAARRGIEIVWTYADEGRSGLTFEGRNALKCTHLPQQCSSTKLCHTD